MLSKNMHKKILNSISEFRGTLRIHHPVVMDNLGFMLAKSEGPLMEVDKRVPYTHNI